MLAKLNDPKTNLGTTLLSLSSMVFSASAGCHKNSERADGLQGTVRLDVSLEQVKQDTKLILDNISFSQNVRLENGRLIIFCPFNSYEHNNKPYPVSPTKFYLINGRLEQALIEIVRDNYSEPIARLSHRYQQHFDGRGSNYINSAEILLRGKIARFATPVDDISKLPNEFRQFHDDLYGKDN